MSTAPPRLAPPGAGLPWWESLVVHWFGRRMLRARFDWEGALTTIARVSSRLAQEALVMNEARLGQRMLVPRLRGLEDSSRYWSPEMLLEHLIITGEMFTDYVIALSQGQPVLDRRGIADIKPRGGLGRAVVVRFIEVHEAIPARLAAEAGPFREGPRHAHAWFGSLNAAEWLSLTALHLKLHGKQWQAIRALSASAPALETQLRS